MTTEYIQSKLEFELRFISHEINSTFTAYNFHECNSSEFKVFVGIYLYIYIYYYIEAPLIT